MAKLVKGSTIDGKLIASVDEMPPSKESLAAFQNDVDDIKKYKVSKLGELEDVDVLNVKDKQILAFSKATGKFIPINGNNIGGGAEGGSYGLQQVTKMGVEASSEKPHKVILPINTIDFKVPKVNVLKYENGDENIVTIKNTFNNNEQNDFESDEMFEFDGTAHLKTNHKLKYELITETEQFTEYSVEVDLDKYKNVETFEDISEGVFEYLNIKAVPKDRLLIPRNDLNLSNVKHIDYFKIKSTGSNIKIVVSPDSGKTWKSFKGENWFDISSLTLDEVKEKGITSETFNNINDVFWNELITNKKVRFAYCFIQEKSDEVECVDELSMQYDGEGKWIQVKETDFDVIYASNSILEVNLKTGGDIKINY